MTRKPKPGPTGEFPRGKRSPDDEGAINIGISRAPDGNVVIDFGAPLKWIAFPPAQAVALAHLILEKAQDPKDKTVQ